MVRQYNLELDAQRHPVLVEEKAYEYNYEELNSPDKVVDFMNEIYKMNVKAEEYVYAIALNTKAKILGVFEISHGAVNKSLASPREIMQRLLLLGTVNYIVCHNHPSEDVIPSKDDDKVAEKLKIVGNQLCIPMIDFIIIGGNKYYSYKQENSL